MGEDTFDNTETTKSTGLIQIDMQAPSTSNNAQEGWHGDNQVVTLTPSDGSGSGTGWFESGNRQGNVEVPLENQLRY